MLKGSNHRTHLGLVTFSPNHDHSLGRPKRTTEVARKSVSQMASPVRRAEKESLKEREKIVYRANLRGLRAFIVERRPRSSKNG